MALKNDKKFDLYVFLKWLSIGFGIVSIGISIAVIGYLLTK